MKIILQYPYIPGVSTCDGRPHTIEPTRIYRTTIGGRSFYVLNYRDEQINGDCTTILVYDGYEFHKVPLENYSEFYEMLQSGEIVLTPVDISILSSIRFIDTYSPIPNINYIKEERAQAQAAASAPPPPPHVGNKPKITLYLDNNGGFYLKKEDAKRIFGYRGYSEYYKLTPKELKFILANYEVKYSLLDGRILRFIDVISHLEMFCTENNVSIEPFLEYDKLKVVYITILQSEDGYFDKSNLEWGLPGFIYENGTFKKFEYNSYAPYVYLKAKTDKLSDGDYLKATSIASTCDEKYIYEFVGAYGHYPLKIDAIGFEAEDETIKEELSHNYYKAKLKLNDILLGYEHSTSLSIRNVKGDNNNNGAVGDYFDIASIRENDESKRKKI